MRQRNTLWRTCRSGGVHDAAKVFWRGRNGVNGVFRAKFAQLLNAQDVQVAEVGLDLLQVLLVGLLVGVIDDIFDGLDIFQNVVKRAEKNRVKENGATLGLNEGMLQSFFSEGIVCSNNGDGLRCSTC